MKIFEKFHSVPALFLFVSFIIGLALSWFIRFANGFEYAFYLLVFFFILFFVFYKISARLFIVITCLFFTVTGYLSGFNALYHFEKNDHFIKSSNKIEWFSGKIIEAEYRNEKSDRYILKTDSIFIEKDIQPFSEKIRVYQGKLDLKLHLGQKIKIFGSPYYTSLPSNPGEFNFRRYSHLNDIFLEYYIPKDYKIHITKGRNENASVFSNIRKFISAKIDFYIPEKSAPVIKALILGERSEIDRDVLKSFQKSGIIHVLAISGLHVGFYVLFIFVILGFLRLPRLSKTVLAILFLLFYCALVDFKAPVVRASTMFSLYLIAQLIGRKQNPLNTFSVAGLLILFFKPEEFFLPGFQYSFSAVFGLVFGAKRLQLLLPYFIPKTKAGKFFKKNILLAAVASFSAILATTPLTVYYYGVVQTGALIANLFAIPIIAIIVLLSLIFLLLSPLSFLPLSGIGLVIDTVVQFMIAITGYFSELPLIQVNVGSISLALALLIGVLVFLLFNYQNRLARLLSFYSFLFLILLSLLKNSAETEKLKITFLSVGQGDGAFIRFPNGKTALIDAGDKKFGLDAGERYVAPFLDYMNEERITYLIGTHPHSDHIGGFEYILHHFDVDTFVDNGFRSKSKLYQRIKTEILKKNIPLKLIQAGDKLNISNNLRLYFLHPLPGFIDSSNQQGEAVNNSSIVAKLVYKNTSFLFMGDAEKAVEEAIQRYGNWLDCDVLKVGHHGSKTSSTDPFLAIAKPEYAVISAGRKNKFKHPDQITINKLINRGSSVFRTDKHGAIVFESDGQKVNFVKWR